MPRNLWKRRKDLLHRPAVKSLPNQNRTGGRTYRMKDIDVLKKQLRLMADRLIEEGKRIPDEPLVIEYDNGGGQSGIRENPFYPAYEKLLTSYSKTLSAVKSMAGSDDAAEISSLDTLRSRFKVAK